MTQIFKIYYANRNKQHDAENPIPGAELLFNLDYSLEQTETKVLVALCFILFTVSITIALKEFRKLRSLVDMIPVSALLLFVGILTGVTTKYIFGNHGLVKLTPIDIPHYWIQHFLITPIILYSSYEIYEIEFFKQFGNVMMMAILGTILNAIFICLSLWLFYTIHFLEEMTIVQCFTYATIISAVDPVAVLGVFEAVNADRSLYYLVFGEALFNDGVTFVLFEGVKELAKLEHDRDIPLDAYIFVGLSMVTGPLGACIIGFLCGILSGLATKYTSEKSEVLQLILVIGLALLAYFLNICLGFSSILGLMICGLTQMRYTIPNLTYKLQMTTTNTLKSVAVLCEILIFVLLGTESTDVQLDKSWAFTTAVFISITVWRFVITFGLVFFINLFRYRKISKRWQTLIFFGGLRGAFAFVMNLEYDGPFKMLFHDTTLSIICATNILNGILAKPLVIFLQLQKHFYNKEKTFFNVTCHVAGLARTGLFKLVKDDTGSKIRAWMYRIEKKYIFKFLCRNNAGRTQLVRDFDKFEKQEALNLIENHSLVYLLHLQKQVEENRVAIKQQTIK